MSIKKLDRKEVRADIYTNNTNIADIVLTHLPTGLSVQGNGALSIRLRVKLMCQLEWLVNEALLAKAEVDSGAIKPYERRTKRKTKD